MRDQTRDADPRCPARQLNHTCTLATGLDRLAQSNRVVSCADVGVMERGHVNLIMEDLMEQGKVLLLDGAGTPIDVIRAKRTSIGYAPDERCIFSRTNGIEIAWWFCWPSTNPAPATTQQQDLAHAQNPDQQLFNEICGMATSGYTRAKADKLIAIACDKTASTGARGYAVMGLDNYSSAMSSEEVTGVIARLRAVVKEEGGDTPDDIVHYLLARGESVWVYETIGAAVRGEPIELDILKKLPAELACSNLWALYQACPRLGTAKAAEQRYEIGWVLARKYDLRGITALMELLPKEAGATERIRKAALQNLISILKLRLDCSGLDDGIDKLQAWWNINKTTVTLGGDDGGTHPGDWVVCGYNNAIANSATVRFVDPRTRATVTVMMTDLINYFQSHAAQGSKEIKEALADKLARLGSTARVVPFEEFENKEKQQICYALATLLQQGKVLLYDAAGLRVEKIQVETTEFDRLFYLPNGKLFFKVNDLDP